MRAVEVDDTLSPLNLKCQRMTEKMQISEQKRTEECKAANQKKIEEQLAAMALAQKSAQLQQSKVEERLVAMVSEQNASQLRQQMTLTDEVKRSAPGKPDYSNLKFFSCRKIGHSAKICKLPKKSMPTVADRKYYHRHQQEHFRRNCLMLASKSGDGADLVQQSTLARKLSTPKTREVYIELVIAGRTCSFCWILEVTLRYFLILLFTDCLSINV